jgi:hypothetical protein
MSLETLANFGEFVAGIGVFVSLLYVGVQTRHNTRAVRGSAQQTWSQISGDLLRDLYSNADLAELFQRVANEREPAGEVDRFRFHVLMLRLVRNAEGLAYLYQRGLVDPHVWGAYIASTRQYMALPGFRSWVKANYELVTPRYRQVLRDLVAEAETRAATYPDSTGARRTHRNRVRRDTLPV